MNIGIDAGLGTLLIIGLVLLLRYVRAQNVRLELDRLQQKEVAKAANQHAWEQLNGYIDSRPRTKRTSGDSAPSYFEAAATGSFRKLK